MSTATFVVALAAEPVTATQADREILEVYASTPGKDPLTLLIRTAATGNPAKGLHGKQPGDLLIASGDLTLNGDNNEPQLFARVICDATSDQYLNEVTIVGRLGGEPRVSESAKSCSRSVAVNRYNGTDELTDWFTVRGYGFTKERLEGAAKGSLVQVAGCLEQRANRDGKPYCELKARLLRVHNRGGGGSGANPAAGTSAQGYAHEDFTGEPVMPFDWSSPVHANT